MRRFSWKDLFIRLILLCIALAFIVLFPGDSPANGSLEDRVIGKSRSYLFNYLAWELSAITSKIGEQSGPAAYIPESARSRYVHDYLDLVARLQRTDAEIEAMYADPKVQDPAAASSKLQTQRQDYAADLKQRQPIAESIIEGQIAAVLRDEGLSVFGEIIPPVSSHIT